MRWGSLWSLFKLLDLGPWEACKWNLPFTFYSLVAYVCFAISPTVGESSLSVIVSLLWVEANAEHQLPCVYRFGGHVLRKNAFPIQFDNMVFLPLRRTTYKPVWLSSTVCRASWTHHNDDDMLINTPLNPRVEKRSIHGTWSLIPYAPRNR